MPDRETGRPDSAPANDASTDLVRLAAENPALMELLRATPPPPGSDTGEARPDEILQARALAILGISTAREIATPPAGATLSSEQLESLVRSVARVVHDDRDQVAELKALIEEVKREQLTQDSVRVLAAKVLGSILGSVAALAALIAAIIKIF